MRGVPPSPELVNRMFSVPQDIHPERMYVVGILPEQGKIYDLGCGRNKTVERAIGVDCIPAVTEICANLDLLPFRDECADVLISRHSLEHLPDSAKTLNEWKRVLKSGGLLVIVLPDDEFIDTMHPVLSAGQHFQAFTRKSFRELVEEVGGFEVLKLETVVANWSFGGVLRKV